MAESVKASVFAIKEEVTAGTLIAPTGAENYIPLRAGSGMTATFENLESDELLNDIGQAEPALGKETPTGTHPIYLKNSEVEGTPPEYGLLIESLLGAKEIASTEYSVTSGSDAGDASTRAALEMGSDEEDNFEVGQAVLIKDGTNGFNIRNVQNVDSVGNQLDLNFNLASAPASGVALGKASLYKPASTGHPSYSAWLYSANGAAIQAQAGCQTNSMTMEFPAGQYATAEFGYAGVSSFYDAIIIGSSNKYIDVTDDLGTIAAVLTEQAYATPQDLAEEMATKLTAISLTSGADTYTVTYDDSTGKFTIASDGSVLSLLWDSGTNTTNSVGTTIGFSVAADDTGALTYTSDSAITLSAPFTPSFDDATNIVVKNAELLIGSFDDTTCIKSTTVSFSIEKTTVDADSICAASGVDEKVPESRTSGMTATTHMRKYETETFDRFKDNVTVSIMMNAGPKDGSGNWIPGKCVNVYMPNAKINQHDLGGDTFVTIDLGAAGFVTSSVKDVYVNYL